MNALRSPTSFNDRLNLWQFGGVLIGIPLRVSECCLENHHKVRSIQPAMRFAAPWLDHNRGWRSHHQPALTAVQNESIIGGLFLLWSTNCNLLHWVSSCKMWLPPSKTTTTTETVIYECYGFAYCEYNCGQRWRRLNESTQDAEKSREREKMFLRNYWLFN